jgi:ATP-dependent protease ClpP protease subunit
MSEVSVVTSPSIVALEGAEMPTFRVSGVVGQDFTGAMLAGAVETYGEVRLVLDSVGGFASDAFHFFDYVRANGLKVHVDGYGTIASAATIIMAAAGRKRSRISANSEYLIHNASGSDAEQVARTNKKMAVIYAELSGKSEKEILAVMKLDKPMAAKDAVKMGLVGSVIENKPLAAKHNPMENTVTEKRVIALTASQRLNAITSGELEVDVDVDAEMSERIGAYAQEVQELTAKLDELKAVADAKAEADAAKAEAENMLATERAALKAATDDIAALRAEIEQLKSQPIAPPVLAKGDDNVEPGAAPVDAPTWKKITGEERARMVASRASSH